LWFPRLQLNRCCFPPAAAMLPWMAHMSCCEVETWTAQCRKSSDCWTSVANSHQRPSPWRSLRWFVKTIIF
jgi:hypothetical protein